MSFTMPRTGSVSPPADTTLASGSSRAVEWYPRPSPCVASGVQVFAAGL